MKLPRIYIEFVIAIITCDDDDTSLTQSSFPGLLHIHRHFRMAVMAIWALYVGYLIFRGLVNVGRVTMIRIISLNCLLNNSKV